MQVSMFFLLYFFLFVVFFSLCVVERLMLAFILDSRKHYWGSIQRGTTGDCSEARQVFLDGFCYLFSVIVIIAVLCLLL